MIFKQNLLLKQNMADRLTFTVLFIYYAVQRKKAVLWKDGMSLSLSAVQKTTKLDSLDKTINFFITSTMIQKSWYYNDIPIIS